MQPEQQQRIMGYFIEEAKDHLNTIEQGLLNLQSTIKEPELVNEIFRAAHSVKGGAAMLGISSIQKTAHRLEDYFKGLKDYPVKVDQKLESLLLRVFDTLQELLEQLQGPFGLTDDVGSSKMSEVEPIFEELNVHMEFLLDRAGETNSVASVSELSVQSSTAGVLSDEALQFFQHGVPGFLREMLQLFKRPDQASNREQLQHICRQLSEKGESINLTAWKHLVDTACQAISNSDNAYRNLAPVVIRDLKQAQEMVLSGQAENIKVSETLQNLLPVVPEPEITESAESLEDLLAIADSSAPSDESVGDLFGAIEQKSTIASETPPVLSEETDSFTARARGVEAESSEFPELDDSFSVSKPVESNGPEVGMAELNSLADLFEGEALDLDETWQEEEIVSETPDELQGDLANSLGLDSTNDFSDLLFDEEGSENLTAEGSNEQDLTDLLGDDFLEFDSQELGFPQSEEGQLSAFPELSSVTTPNSDPKEKTVVEENLNISRATDSLSDLFEGLDEDEIFLDESESEDADFFDLGLDIPNALSDEEKAISTTDEEQLGTTGSEAQTDSNLNLVDIPDPWSNLGVKTGASDEKVDSALTDEKALSNPEAANTQDFGDLLGEELFSESTASATVTGKDKLNELSEQVEDLAHLETASESSDSSIVPSAGSNLETVQDPWADSEIPLTDKAPLAVNEEPALAEGNAGVDLNSTFTQDFGDVDLEFGTAGADFTASETLNIAENPAQMAVGEFSESANNNPANLSDAPLEDELLAINALDLEAQDTPADPDLCDSSKGEHLTSAMDKEFNVDANEGLANDLEDLFADDAALGMDAPEVSEAAANDLEDLFADDAALGMDAPEVSEAAANDLEDLFADDAALEMDAPEVSEAAANDLEDLFADDAALEMDAPEVSEAAANDLEDLFADDAALEMDAPEVSEAAANDLEDLFADDAALEMDAPEVSEAAANDLEDLFADDAALEMDAPEVSEAAGASDELDLLDAQVAPGTSAPNLSSDFFDDMGDLFGEDESKTSEPVDNPQIEEANLLESQSIVGLDAETQMEVSSDLDLDTLSDFAADLATESSSDPDATVAVDLEDLFNLDSTIPEEGDANTTEYSDNADDPDATIAVDLEDLLNLDSAISQEDSDADAASIANLPEEQQPVNDNSTLKQDIDDLDFVEELSAAEAAESEVDKTDSLDNFLGDLDLNEPVLEVADPESAADETDSLDDFLGDLDLDEPALDIANAKLSADDSFASIEEEDIDSNIGDVSVTVQSAGEFDDLEALLEEEPAASETSAESDEEFDDLEALLEEEPAASETSAESDEEFDDLEALLEEEPAASETSAESDEEFDDLEALLEEEPEITGEFDDLEALLGEEPAASETSAESELDDFSDLEALLGDDGAAAIARSATPLPGERIDASRPKPAPVESPEIDDEFGDLEKLLEDADNTMPGSPTIKTAPRQGQPVARRRRAAFEQTMRVPVKNLNNLNNLVGELVVNRNSLEQGQERLRQFLDNLLHQVQQLSDVGQRMQDLYERSLLESSLLANRQSHRASGSESASAQATHSTGMDFDALEMDRFTGFHTLSQEMIEMIVRVRESSSDIEFLVGETDQVARSFRQVTTQLQEGLTRARMVPFAQAADRLPRAVRDIAIKCGKQAELQIEGRDILIDKVIMEQLYDPMTHLVNNAITHGIESPEVRQINGKSSVGTITIRAFRQGNQTVISVSDDGAGIPVEKVKGKAIQKGLITSADAKTMSDLDVYELLFHPGFSTKDKADDFAGRGVGMDVVRTSLSEIRGAINTDSEIGKGTTFTIRLPLTLSICKALCCISDRAQIAFPMDGVEDMLDISKDRIQNNEEGQPCLFWRDTLLPFRPLKELLTYNRRLGRSSVYGATPEEDIISVIVLRSGGNFIALQVDRVLGEQEIVIKQLEGPVPKPVGVAGATVLGDGRIMPIADVLELIDLSMGRVRREGSGNLWDRDETQIPVDVPTAKSDPTVLIVDDSITVRELLSMTFNKAGYRVEQARDGQEAWEKLRSGLPCDIVFCDIEMPRMDGLELLSRLQKDTSLSHLPIAMLTSRGADRHRQMAVQLGASGYFTKPYLEEALLDAAQRMLKGEVLVTAAVKSE